MIKSKPLTESETKNTANETKEDGRAAYHITMPYGTAAMIDDGKISIKDMTESVCRKVFGEKDKED